MRHIAYAGVSALRAADAPAATKAAEDVLAAVTDAQVDAYFAPLGAGELGLPA
ncbi:hypothetical protein ACWF82_22000 [Nocardia sp. NPDC055053]